ncbi:MAG: type II toxin-antitoxin system RelE/ParE family toxin [Acidobacteriota bacterium]|nr:type II toxin-antitoxin system RelE/ParE family toxin [Acidobacteriota bacterium]
MPWAIEYYVTRDHSKPVQEWLNGLSDKKLKAKMYTGISKLGEHGVDILIKTDFLRRISGDDDNLYEIRGEQGRITVHFDRARNVFILLNAFLKKRQKEKRKIDESRRFLHDYLEKKGE